MGLGYRFLVKYGGHKEDPRVRLAVMETQRATRRSRDTSLFGSLLRRWTWRKLGGMIVILILAIVMFFAMV